MESFLKNSNKTWRNDQSKIRDQRRRQCPHSRRWWPLGAWGGPLAERKEVPQHLEVVQVPSPAPAASLRPPSCEVCMLPGCLLHTTTTATNRTLQGASEQTNYSISFTLHLCDLAYNVIPTILSFFYDHQRFHYFFYLES